MLLHFRVMLLGGLMAASFSAVADEKYIVLDQGKTDPYWTRIGKSSLPLYPKSAVRNMVEACMAIGFSIESSGKPGIVSVLRMQTNKSSDDDDVKKIKAAAMEAITDWRYVAAPGNPERKAVFTYTTMSMTISGPDASASAANARSQSMEQSCRIADFAVAVSRGDFKPKTLP